ncbi:MAG: hypothetical protein ACT4NJ_00850 [Nitrosopumilaceae archaeon]
MNLQVVDSRLKIKFLIAGGLIAFGIFNMFWFFIYMPILLTPFPFEHVVVEYIAKGTASIQTEYIPLEAARDTYWLFWSFAMYFGFGYLAFLVIRLEKKFRRHVVKKAAKIAVIATGVGFGLYVGITFAVYSIIELLPEPDPFLEAEFYQLQETYKSGEPIYFQVHLNGYDYTLSYMEIYIKDYSGNIIWSDNNPDLPFGENVDGPYYTASDVPNSDDKPIVIFAPGTYTIEINLSRHTVTKEFSIEM